MLLSEFDYQLPPELIAQEPLPDRAASRMLVLHRAEQRWEDRHFVDLPSYLQRGDCLVLNNSRVLASRLYGQRLNPAVEGIVAKVEVLLLEAEPGDALQWKALVRPGKKLRSGDRIRFDETLSAEVIGHGERGERTLRFSGTENVYAELDRIGHMPLPPYIRREDSLPDKARYQTVYAREDGSAAAPTAGLHFTDRVLRESRAAGAHVAEVTLHVGLGTFQPLKLEHFESSRLHQERYSIESEAWRRIENAKRVVAVGTTSVRTIESAAGTRNLSGTTDIFIYPGYRFLRADAMLTNFHLPKTSLVLLVSAFAGKDFVLAAYRHAVAQRYRFFSYGDCMLIV